MIRVVQKWIHVKESPGPLRLPVGIPPGPCKSDTLSISKKKHKSTYRHELSCVLFMRIDCILRVDIVIMKLLLFHQKKNCLPKNDEKRHESFFLNIHLTIFKLYYNWIQLLYFCCYFMVKKTAHIMVLIWDGNSLTVAHVRRNLCFFTCLRHLIRSRAVRNRIFPCKNLFSLLRAQNVLNYHLIYHGTILLISHIQAASNVEYRKIAIRFGLLLYVQEVVTHFI